MSEDIIEIKPGLPGIKLNVRALIGRLATRAKSDPLAKDLRGGEFWTDGYYIGTISSKGSKAVIEKYIRNQGREKDLPQLRLFAI